MPRKSKGWRKVTKYKTFTTWQRNEEDMFLTIVKQKYNPQAWGYKKKTDYIVTVGTHSTHIIDKHFKTKPQALRFAKKYMRKH